MSSDPREAVREAIAELKKLAAKELIAKEEAQKGVAALETKLAGVQDDLHRLLDANQDDLASEMLQIKTELSTQLESKQAALAGADAAYQSALKEIKDLEKQYDGLKGAKAKATVDAAMHVDPFAPDAASAALDRVRSHIRETEAQVTVNRKLAGDRAADDAKAREAESKLKDFKAKQELARLKAARQQSKESAETEPDAPADEPEATEAPKKPKRTL